MKTRTEGTRLVSEGGVRVIRGGSSRALDKASAGLAVGDTLAFPHRGGLKLVRIEGVRRGPPAEARALYSDLEGDANADIEGLA